MDIKRNVRRAIETTLASILLTVGVQKTSAQEAAYAPEQQPVAMEYGVVYATPETQDTVRLFRELNRELRKEAVMLCMITETRNDSLLVNRAYMRPVKANGEHFVMPSAPHNPCGAMPGGVEEGGSDMHWHWFEQYGRYLSEPGAADKGYYLMWDYLNELSGLHCIFTEDESNCYQGVVIGGRRPRIRSMEQLSRLLATTPAGEVTMRKKLEWVDLPDDRPHRPTDQSIHDIALGRVKKVDKPHTFSKDNAYAGNMQFAHLNPTQIPRSGAAIQTVILDEIYRRAKARQQANILAFVGEQYTGK